MFFLPWWTYVLVGTVAFTCALAGQWLANRGELGVEQPDEGPYPCGEHLGTDEDGAEDWCWQITGHPGEHLGMRQDWPGVLESTDCACHDAEGFSVLPELPQRLDNVPHQKVRSMADWCGAQSSDGKCFLAAGHERSHNYI